MNPAKPKLDAVAYLLGGVGLLAISTLPLLVIGMNEVQPIGKLIIAFYWVLGGLALWWAIHRFVNIGERLVAVIGIVIGWYMLLGLLNALNTMFLRL